MNAFIVRLYCHQSEFVIQFLCIARLYCIASAAYKNLHVIIYNNIHVINIHVIIYNNIHVIIYNNIHVITYSLFVFPHVLAAQRAESSERDYAAEGLSLPL